MQDYLAEVRKPARIAAIVGLALSTLVFGAGFAGLIAMALLQVPANAAQAASAIGAIVVFAAFAAVSLWMLLRLLRGARDPSGVTVMPIWFIEVAGVLLACGILAAAIVDRSASMLVSSLTVIGAMTLVRRSVRAKLRRKVEAAELPDITECHDDLETHDVFRHVPEK